MAFSTLPGCPLYHRDVEKFNRQDDNAVTRLFSAAALDFIIKQLPDRLGLVAYLLVMGEVFDAYQSRKITHFERTRMVLRCRYLLDYGNAFLMPKSRHYISREANDILDIHRDHHSPGRRYLLLPWLHSRAETCEHVFAECRKLVKDFAYLNFLHMIPGLHVMVRAASLFSKGTDPKAQAMGYSHSCLDPEKARIESFASYPTDGEIAPAVGEAWGEAVTLLRLLGIQAEDLPKSSTVDSADSPSIPPTPIGTDPVDEEDADKWNGGVNLQRPIIIQQSSGRKAMDSEAKDKMHMLTCAAIALDIDERTTS